MSWFKKLFLGDQESQLKDTHIKQLESVIEQNTETMKQMNQAMRVLEGNLSDSRDEMAYAVESERERVFGEMEYTRKVKKEKERKERRLQDEKIVSTFLSKYLDRFNISQNRFSLKENLPVLNSSEDLLFKVAQMFKLSKEKVEHIELWNDYMIRIDIYNEDLSISYSVDNGETIYTDSVGIKFLYKFISDIEQDVYNLPCTRSSNIYKVEGKNYSYVLARNEKECFFILKDRDMKTKIELVEFVEEECFVRSLKSNIVYMR